MHQVVKILELQLQLHNEYSGLISFRIDWFDILAVDIKSLLQESSPRVFSSTTIQKHQFYRCKVMSLLFNTLSRSVTAFLLRSKCLLISWLQSLSVVFWEATKIKSVTVSTFSPSNCHEVMGPDTMVLVF